MQNRTTRAHVARQTLDFIERGGYTTASGQSVSFGESLQLAREGTRLYTPDCFADVFRQIEGTPRHFTTNFCVTNCTTFAAARSLVETGASADTICLNFASAKHPGGGFLGGSQAQEESLARASGLYACIEPVHGYYAANRACGSCLYTHHMIYSPNVPVFRDDDDELQSEPFVTSLITAPAVNAGAVRQNEPQRTALIESTMSERIERVLALAFANGHNKLVLGAWGCGVFKNDPVQVARWFHQQLTENRRFQNAFDTVVFAVLDRTADQRTFRAFARQFEASGT